MKKKMGLLFSGVLVAAMLAGCGSAGNTAANAGASGGVKTGVGITADISGSKDAASGEDGVGAADVTIAAVTVDEDGKILKCTIDAVQAKVGFNNSGMLTTDLGEQFPTKQELGEKYTMKGASAIGKEWNEQADAFAAYCVGKSTDEIAGIAVTEEGTAADADLAASCTIHIGGLQAAVTAAVDNASNLGANASDKLGLGVTTNVSQSTDAGEKDGTAVPYVTVCALTVNDKNVISSSVIDAVQAKISFNAQGRVTQDTAAEVLSKNALGEGYGMKAASSIGKEWNEQAAAYAEYVLGKTPKEVNETAVSEGVPADEDLAASVTIHIGDFNEVIGKAAATAK